MSKRNTGTKAEQLKAIKGGKGVQHILNEGYKILGNPALIHDMEYILIAASPCAIDDDPIWNEFMRNGKLGGEIIAFFEREGFIDDIANSTLCDGVTYLISDKLKYNRIFGQLYNKCRIPVADLAMLECESPFEEDSPQLVKILCEALSKELGRNTYYKDYGKAYLEKIIKELIEGVAVSSTYTGHVANIDCTLKNNIFVGVADVSRSDAGRGGLAHFRDVFERTQPFFAYYMHHDQIVMLMSWDDKELHEKQELAKFRRLFERENIYAGVSGRFENLFDLHRRYEQAVEALDNGLSGQDSQRILFYDEIEHDG